MTKEMQDAIEEVKHWDKLEAKEEMRMRSDDDYFNERSSANDLLYHMQQFKKECEQYGRDFDDELNGLKDSM